MCEHSHVNNTAGVVVSYRSPIFAVRIRFSDSAVPLGGAVWLTS